MDQYGVSLLVISILSENYKDEVLIEGLKLGIRQVHHTVFYHFLNHRELN